MGHDTMFEGIVYRITSSGRFSAGHWILGVVVVAGLLGLILQRHEAVKAVSAAAGPTAFVVDGNPEPLSDWKNALLVAQALDTSGASIGTLRAQLFQAKEEGFAALHTAQQAGLSVGDSEVASFVARMRSQIAAIPAAAAQVQRVEQVLGITDDQYWAYLQPDYAAGLVTAKLKQQYYNSLGSLNLNEKAQKWEAYLHQLASTATITITDPADVQ